MSSTTQQLENRTDSALSTTASTNASAAKKMTTSGSKAADHAGGQQKPAAWTRSSINPVTQRASGSPVQNGVKSNGAPTTNAVKPPANAAKAANGQDRMLFLVANMKGLSATLLLKNGDRYTGIFSAQSDGRYIIKMAKKLAAHGKQANGVSDELVGAGPDRTMAISVQDVVDLSVDDVRFDKTQSRAANGASASFRTDTDISSAWQGRERQLQRWAATDDGTDVDLSLGNGHVGEWDQFAAHKKMTGLESTYDENHYTTPLNRSRPGFDDDVRKAEQLAREIEGSSSTNAHIAEERGLKSLDDSGMDEEAKYSGVQRDFKPLASSGTNKYTPPAMRAPTGQATVPGAPVDPAIISSSFADTSKPKAAPAKKMEETTNTTAEASKPSADKEASKTPIASSKPTEKPAVPTPAPRSTVAASIPPAQATNKEGGATATVEADLLASFKEFKAAEKMRVQEFQRTAARRDKAVKLNDLKKFAQNFKLHTEVPADLLPILARDEGKQLEIKEKAKKIAEETKSTPPRSTATSAAATPADAKSKPNATKNESGPVSPLASSERQPQQRSRQSSTTMGSATKGAPPQMHSGQGGGHRQAHGQLGQRLAMNAQMNRAAMPQVSHPMPIPDSRMGAAGVLSPTSAMRLDPTKSFVPNAATKSFVPGGSNNSSGSSPVRAPSSQPAEPKAPTPGSLFEGRTEGRKGIVPDAERPTLENAFNPIPTLKKEHEASLPEGKRASDVNGGLPPPHRTNPTWFNLVPDANKDKSYKDMFANSLKPAASPQYGGPAQFQHQLPYGQHHGYPPQAGLTPSQTPHRMVAQLHHAGPGTPHHFEESQRMQFSQSTSSVHPSPRGGQPYVYNPQGAPQGQQFPPGMVYGTSPGGYSMMTRQLSNQPQFHGQPPQMMPGQGPPVYMMPGQPGQAMYPVGQPFFPPGAHMHPGQPGAGVNGYPSPGPRAVMMAPQGSQSGHNTPQVMPYFAAQGGPVPQMRYAGGPPHGGQPQYPQGQHFGQHPMRGTPSASYVQPMMVAGQQGGGMMMPPSGQMVPDSGGDDAK